MTETRSHASHAYDRVVPAEIEDVWRALTEPDEAQQSFYDHVVESTWMPGEPVRWLDDRQQPLMEGTVLDIDPPHRVVHTFAYTRAGSADGAADAPSTVTWTMEPDDEGTRVMLVHDGFETGSATWRTVDDAWEQVLDGLVQLFEQDEDDE